MFNMCSNKHFFPKCLHFSKLPNPMKQCSFRLYVFSAYVHYILLNLAESKMKKCIIYMQNTVVTPSNIFFTFLKCK